MPPPLWPSLVEAAVRIDVPVNAPDEPGEEYVFWANSGAEPSMRRATLIWATVAALYGAFLFWYDGGGGPLSPAEIERYVAVLEQRGARQNRSRACARSSRTIRAATS